MNDITAQLVFIKQIIDLKLNIICLFLFAIIVLMVVLIVRKKH